MMNLRRVRSVILAVFMLFWTISYGLPEIRAEEGIPENEKTDEAEGKQKAVPAPSQEKASESEETLNRAFTLGEIDVVAKEEESKNKTIDKVYYEEMRLFNRDNVADAVNLLPGVTLSETGARNEKMIYIRGFDIKHVPLFLDGIPIYVPYDGYPDLARFNTFNLSEIVVSKGFTSVLYGPNTMGGAINMVSRRPVKEFEGNVGAGFEGPGNTYHGYMNFGGNQGKWYFQGGGSYMDSDHFSVSDSFSPTAVQGDGARVNSDRTDWSANIKFGYTPNDTDEYAITYINQQAVKGDPPYTGISDDSKLIKWWKWPSWNKESVYANTKTTILDSSYVKTRLFYDTFDNSLNIYTDETYNTLSSQSWYNDYTYGGSIEGGTELVPYNTIKTSFHFKDDVHREHDDLDPTQHFEDRIFSVGLEDTIDITKKWYAIIGASFDYVNAVEAQDYNSNTKTMSDYDMHDEWAVNPQAGLFYKVTDTGTAHMSLADKSRLPSLKDRYSYKFGKAIPNPDLKPEESLNYEIGYQDLLFKKYKIEGNFFYSQISDFILSVDVPDPSDPTKTKWQNRNIGHVDQWGFELGVSGPILPCLNGGVNYTYIEYKNLSTTEKLTGIPNHKVFAFLQYFTPLKGLSWLSSVEFNGERYSDSDGIRVADQYALLNTKAIYEGFMGFTIEGGINNLTDEDYALDEGYPLAGRTFFMNLMYKW